MMLDKASRRAELEAALAAFRTPLPPGPFEVLLADPPWRFKVWSRATGLDGAADNHYAVLLLSEIMALSVESIAAKHARLFLWTTAPMERRAHDVMEAWGFTYKSQAAWDKGLIGTGYIFRNQHEILLYGARGKPRAPPPSVRRSSVIRAPRRRHSQKPDEAYEMIEAYFPDASKLELYARGPPRPGWRTWGAEAVDLAGC
jgi:N6-adenosine-specific RNA methylase IME4